MAETAIEWTDRSWNPIVGCTIVSPGCTNCYAMTMAARLEAMAPQPNGDGNPHLAHYMGTTTRGEYLSKPPVWTGTVKRAPDHAWQEPLRRRKPTTWFVNSMGDLFHEGVPDAWIDEVFAIMALCPQHTFQILTKRAARMRSYMTARAENWLAHWSEVIPAARWRISRHEGMSRLGANGPVAAALYDAKPISWPLPNVWLGVSTEDQKRADERIPDLLATPAAIRFVSAEPLLGPIDFTEIMHAPGHALHALWGLKAETDGTSHYGPRLDWIIAGGESGKGARPTHPDWVRRIRDQCRRSDTAFFFKQWGEWQPREWCRDGGTHALNSHPGHSFQKIQSHPDSIERVGAGPDWVALAKVGKKAAGRVLDGFEHNAMPEGAR